MTKFSIAALSLVVIMCLAFPSHAKPQASAAGADRKPVVVELFTSEGCSSCPPADILLQKLDAQQPVTGALVIALEEHVDYWNHDGWIDPYSSPEWTQRQQTYVNLERKDAYTPELVIDGRSQFVGNSPREAVLEIEKAAREPRTDVAITTAPPDSRADSKDRAFHVVVGKLAAGTSGDAAEIWLAITEDGLHSSVSKGENAGHVLRHVATLRSLRKIGIADANLTPVSFTGDPVVKFDSHWNVGKIHVAVFVQKKKSREILGAASTTIQPESKLASGN